MIRRFLASLLFMACTVGQAQAFDLVLEYQGSTFGSSLGGNSIADGTSFQIDATFNTTLVYSQPGLGIYKATAITVEVGGTFYTVPNPAHYRVQLNDPLFNNLGLYFAVLYNGTNGSGFIPYYTTATPALSGIAPSPTVYSGYSGSFGSSGSSGAELVMSTTGGSLTLGYDPTAGVSAAILPTLATPEPSGLVLQLGLAAGGLVRFLAWRRGRRTSAA